MSFTKMNKYDKVFLQQAIMGYSRFLSRYHKRIQDEDLRERRNLLDKEFIFSEANIKRLKNLNDLLTERSIAAYEHAEKLESEVLTLMKNPNPFILDYEIEFELSFFAEKKYSHIPDLQGNPFFECKPIWFQKADHGKESERKEHKDWLFKTDHKEGISEDHPLFGFPHCYMFHDLIDHSILSYQDIIDIEDVWMEIVLTVQNFQDMTLIQN